MGESVGRMKGWATTVFALLFREEADYLSERSRPLGFLQWFFAHGAVTKIVSDLSTKRQLELVAFCHVRLPLERLCNVP